MRAPMAAPKRVCTVVSVSMVTSRSWTWAASHTRCRMARWIFNICPAALRCSDAKNRQKVDWGGSRTTFRMPTNIGSRSRKRR